MKKLLTLLFASVFALVSLVSCSTNTPKQNVGMITGGIAGGLIGSAIGGGTGQLIAIGAGTLLGAFIGSEVGKSMDDQDRMRMNTAFESDRVTYWKSKNGTTYRVVPSRTMMTYNGNPNCREYYTTVKMTNGKSKRIYGVACRQNDGSWMIVK